MSSTVNHCYFTRLIYTIYEAIFALSSLLLLDSMPWVSIQLSTGVQFLNSASDDINLLFLYSVNKDNDSLVAFAHGYTAPINLSIEYDIIESQVYFDKSEIVII